MREFAEKQVGLVSSPQSDSDRYRSRAVGRLAGPDRGTMPATAAG